MSIQKVSRRLRVTLRLQVPLRSPVRVWTFQTVSACNSSGFSIVEVRQHLPELVYGIGRHALGLVLLVESPEAFMGKVPNFHGETVTCSLTLIGATSLPEPLETCPMPPFGIAVESTARYRYRSWPLTLI